MSWKGKHKINSYNEDNNSTENDLCQIVLLEQNSDFEIENKKIQLDNIYDDRKYFILLSLNDDCLYKICTYLNLRERIYLDKLSNRFNKILCHILMTETLCLNSSTLKDITLKEISDFIQRYGNKIENIHVYPINVAYDYRISKFILKYCINLKLLKFENITIYNNFERNFNKLNELTISHVRNSNKIFESIMENCKNLKKLTIYNLTESNIANHIGKFNSLIDLEIIQEWDSQPLYYNLYEFLEIIGRTKLSEQLENLSVQAFCFSSNFWLSLVKLKGLKIFYINKITALYDEDKFLYCIENIEKIENMHIVYDIKLNLKNILNIIDTFNKRTKIMKFRLDTGITYTDLMKLSQNENYIACQTNPNISFKFSTAYFEDNDMDDTAEAYIF